jgi:hypothetical protein
LGRYRETNVERADLETTITDLMTEQFGDPVRIVAFNIVERWAVDVSEDIAREIMRRFGLAGCELPASLESFVERHIAPAAQPGSPPGATAAEDSLEPAYAIEVRCEALTISDIAVARVAWQELL